MCKFRLFIDIHMYNKKFSHLKVYDENSGLNMHGMKRDFHDKCMNFCVLTYK